MKNIKDIKKIIELRDLLKSFAPYEDHKNEIDETFIRGFDRDQAKKFIEKVEKLQSGLGLDEELELELFRAVYVEHVGQHMPDELVDLLDADKEISLYDWRRAVRHSEYLDEYIDLDFFEGKSDVKEELQELETDLKENLDPDEYPDVRVVDEYQGLSKIYREMKEKDIVVKINEMCSQEPIRYENFYGNLSLGDLTLLEDFSIKTSVDIYEFMEFLDEEIRKIDEEKLAKKLKNKDLLSNKNVLSKIKQIKRQDKWGRFIN